MLFAWFRSRNFPPRFRVYYNEALAKKHRPKNKYYKLYQLMIHYVPSGGKSAVVMPDRDYESDWVAVGKVYAEWMDIQAAEPIPKDLRQSHPLSN